MKILGFQTGHDVSYAILENGIPIIHEELERFTRQKEPLGDGLKMAIDRLETIDDINYFCMGNYGMYQPAGIRKWTSRGCYFIECVDQMNKVIKNNNGKFYEIGHHRSHAANAFFSSNFDNALIITMDGGGAEEDMTISAFTVWNGNKNKIYPIEIIPDRELNLGVLWLNYTTKVFGLSGTGGPKGSQAGTVMGMAALGNPNKFKDNWQNISLMKNYALQSEQNQFDIAASLQQYTENIIYKKIKHYLTLHPNKNLCLSGGVALNCVMTGKIKKWFPELENVYIDPVPYDGGLALGSARYVWHHVLNNPRIKWKDNSSPYLGMTYNQEDIESCLNRNDIKYKKVTDDDVVQLLNSQKIISVFNKGSESGRRALGNRSIIADPRSDKMKDMINEKVKHRQWFRPFAPSILKEEVINWFEYDINSPYMSFAISFKKEMKDKVPAVVHFDGSARLQTVTENDNKWYYNFIKKWFKVSGVPIVLNTSFNDREPIVETPEHAINCFIGTDIDYLYFSDVQILVEKNK